MHVYIDISLLTLGACARVTVVIVCVCVSVTALAATYLVYTLKLDAFRLCVTFSRYALCGYRWKALFKSSGDICWSPWPFSLLDELSMDESDSDGLFSRRLVCRSTDSSYDLTDSSLVTEDYQLWFLPLTFFVCTKSADLAYTYMCTAAYVIACSGINAFLWLL